LRSDHCHSRLDWAKCRDGGILADVASDGHISGRLRFPGAVCIGGKDILDGIRRRGIGCDSTERRRVRMSIRKCRCRDYGVFTGIQPVGSNGLVGCRFEVFEREDMCGRLSFHVLGI
jgi:hypothetical protein